LDTGVVVDTGIVKIWRSCRHCCCRHRRA
jgi:hypothetical protein